jgi:hypothetical protein
MSEQFQTPSESDSSAVSWPAVAAGAIAIAALTLVLLTIGSALGFSSVSPWSNSGVSAQTFQIGTGLYLVVTALLSSTIGGYLSGRLRTKWKGVHSYEVQFRDTAHGFLAWALAAILGAAVLGGAATYLVGGVVTGAAQGAAAGATQGAAANSDYYVAKLMRPSGNSAASAANSAAPAAPADNSGTAAAPVTGTTAAAGRTGPNPNQQVRVIWAHGLTGDLSQSDRAYLSQLVAAQSGMSQAEADKRVDEVLAQAKQEADQARKVAASVSIWLAISMLVGAFSAGLAAIEGGQLRDRRWRGIIGTRAYNEARIDA